jgi:hypothetical protein
VVESVKGSTASPRFLDACKPRRLWGLNEDRTGPHCQSEKSLGIKGGVATGCRALVGRRTVQHVRVPSLDRQSYGFKKRR